VPSVDAYVEARPGLVTKLLDRDGNAFASYSRERRQMIEDGKLPPLLQNAVLAAEDAQFFHHGGVDLVGIVRSTVLNALRGRRAFGASTVTMQLARTLMGRREKTWNRKVAETLLATSEQLDARTMVVKWLESRSHRAIILKPSWREVGVGAHFQATAPGDFGGAPTTVVTADFGARAGRVG